VEQFIIFTGEVEISKSSNEDEYIFRKQPSKRFVAETPFALAGEDKTIQAVGGWAAGKPVEQKVATLQDEQGKPVVLVESHYSTGWWGKRWFLPDHGWGLRRVESYTDTNQLAWVNQVEEFGTVNGIIFPRRGRQEQYLARDELGASVDFEVDSIQASAANIPDSLFQFDLPKTASVWDDDLEVTVRNTDLTESHLKEVAARAGGHGGWAWWVWLSLGVGLLAVVAAAYWLVRRRKRFSRAPPGPSSK
jgi:hypothetical protein